MRNEAHEGRDLPDMPMEDHPPGDVPGLPRNGHEGWRDSDWVLDGSCWHAAVQGVQAAPPRGDLEVAAMTTFPARRARSGHHVGQTVGSRDNALPRRAGVPCFAALAAESERKG